MSFLEKYSKYKGVARSSLLIIGVLFVLILAKESWSEISGLVKHVNVGKFLFSVIIGIVGNLAMAIYFNRLIGKHGVNISDRLAVKMYMVGQIAKYIPGKIWGMAYQASHVTGMAGAAGVVLANMEMMLSVMFMTSIVALILLCSLAMKYLAALLALLGMCGFLFLYKTNFVNHVLKLLSRKFKALTVFEEVEKRQTGFVEGTIFYLIFCTVYVLSNVLMLDAVFHFSFSESATYIALLSVAWIGGVFAFIVPAGMGVREVLFVAASSYMLPEYSVEILASIAIFSRLWQIIQEFTGMSLSLLIRHD